MLGGCAHASELFKRELSIAVSIEAFEQCPRQAAREVFLALRTAAAIVWAVIGSSAVDGAVQEFLDPLISQQGCKVDSSEPPCEFREREAAIEPTTDTSCSSSS